MNASRQRHMEDGTLMWVRDRDHGKTPSQIKLYFSTNPISVSPSAALISFLTQIKPGFGDRKYLVTLQGATLKTMPSLPQYFQFIFTCCWKPLPRSFKVCVTNTDCSAGRPDSQELLLIHVRINQQVSSKC